MGGRGGGGRKVEAIGQVEGRNKPRKGVGSEAAQSANPYFLPSLELLSLVNMEDASSIAI